MGLEGGRLEPQVQDEGSTAFAGGTPSSVLREVISADVKTLLVPSKSCCAG